VDSSDPTAAGQMTRIQHPTHGQGTQIDHVVISMDIFWTIRDMPFPKLCQYPVISSRSHVGCRTRLGMAGILIGNHFMKVIFEVRIGDTRRRK
jgi:hypothetical protein